MSRQFYASVAIASAATFSGTWYVINSQQVVDTEAAPQEYVYYSGCNDARAAGAAPVYRGEPGYREDMDGDNDGIACEPYRGGY